MLAAALLMVFLGILMRQGLVQGRILEAQIRANFEKDDLVDALARAHEEAKNGQAQVAAMLETSPAGIAIFIAGGELLFVNARFVNLFGYQDAEQALAAGPPANPIELPATVDGDAGASRGHRCRQVTRAGRQWWCLYHQRPITYHGRRALIAWYYDITAQVTVEEEAVASAQFLSLTLETMDQGIMVIDSDERVVQPKRLPIDRRADAV